VRNFLDCAPEEAMILWTEFATDNPLNQAGLAATERAIASGVAQPPYEMELVGKQGRHIWVEVREAPVVEDGETVAIVGSLTDITARKRAEETLQRREAELTTLVENADDLIVRFDTELHYVYCNPAVERQLGVPASTFLNKSPSEIGTTDEHATFIKRTLRRVLDTGERLVVEERYDTPVGPKHYQTHIVPERNRKGEIDSLLAVSRDFTERKRAEEALQQAHQRLKNFFDHSPRLISIFDREGRYQVVNRALAQSLARPEEQIVGRTFADLLPPDVAATFMRRVERLVEAQAPLVVNDEVEIEGERRIFRSLLFPLSQDREGRQIFASMASDVTQREAMEQRLRESRERLSLAVEGAELATWDWDLQTGETVRSRRWAEMQGYPYDEIEPTLEFWEEHVHPEDAPGVRAALDAHLEGRTTHYQAEYRLRTKAGGWKWILDTGKVLVRDEAGTPLRIVGIHQDITERKEAEEQLARYAADLQRSNEELEHFAHIVSHDLQEPARIVEGYLELLEGRCGGKLDEKAISYIRQARESAARMQQMIRALLNLSRVGRRDQDLAPTDVEALLERTLRALQRAVEETGAEVTHDPLPTVMADEAQLGQVFQNLIANALKFRRESVPPHVHISARREGETWLFAVADNGIGIDPQQADRIFEIFQRLHTWEEYPGTGIGLALSRKIIERHGGRIWVESEPGEGATFYFTLPVGSPKRS
jgi:PAS domain S-box-containing protein